MKSQKLKKVAFRYITNNLDLDHRREITKKFFALLKRWIPYSKNKNFENFHSLCTYIEENPKFKLPWTVLEAREAAKDFCSWFNVYSCDK